jgi:hypothetical protein
MGIGSECRRTNTFELNVSHHRLFGTPRNLDFNQQILSKKMQDGYLANSTFLARFVGIAQLTRAECC